MGSGRHGNMVNLLASLLGGTLNGNASMGSYVCPYQRPPLPADILPP
jgi:hypothetical protein